MSTPLFNTKTGDVVINISCIGKNVWSFSSTLRFNYVIIECTRKIFERLQHQAKDIDRCKYFNKIFLSTRIHLLWVERSVLRSWETMSGWQNMKSLRIWQPTNSTHEQNNLSVISKINITMIFRCMEQLKKLDLKPWPITQIVVILYDLIWKLLLRNRKDKTTQKKKDFSLGPSHISIIHIISILYACYIRIINVLQSSITFADDLPFVQRGKMLHLVVT